MPNFTSPLRILQTDFRAGELDPLIYMRVDSKIYPSGAQSLKNMMVYNTGAISRRPGLQNLNTITKKTRLMPFEFDVDEKYIFAFGDEYLGIYAPDGTLDDSFTGSTDCPWDADQAWELTIEQAGDVMFIFHESFKSKVCTRTGATTFTMADFEFATDRENAVSFQPYYRHADETIGMEIDDHTVGTGRTLTASSSFFTSAMVGERLQLMEGEVEITAYTSTTVVTVEVTKEIRRFLVANALRVEDNTAVIEIKSTLHGLDDTYNINLEGTISIGGIGDQQWQGVEAVTVIDEDTFTVTAGTNATSAAIGGAAETYYSPEPLHFFTDWREAAFSDARGWPGCGAIHQNRLWLAGSTEIPLGVWGSEIGDYYNFDLAEGEDTAAIHAILSAPLISKIKHIMPAKALMFFADAVEFVVEQRQGEPITPGNLSVKPQTRYGVQQPGPVMFDNAVIFIQHPGKVVREFIYDYQSDGYLGPAISVTSSHLVKNPVDMAAVVTTDTRPEQYTIIVNNDGTAALFHSIRSENLAAWTPVKTNTGDTIESVCVIGHDIYFAVLRGSTRYLEQLMLDSEDYWLDGAISMSGASTVTWALGSDYASKTVDVMSNGHYLGQYTANGSGTITLDDAVTSIVAGYDPGIEVIPMTPDKELTDGPITGEKRRINEVIFHVRDSTCLTVNSRDLIGPGVGDDLAVSPDEITGKRVVRLLGYDRDPVYTVTQSSPGPLTILGTQMKVSL